MEVHAHTHTARKKWTHYFWEFLMLFLAVFCGFWAENQREHYIEKKREKQYILSMTEDLKKDAAFLELCIQKFIPNHVKLFDSAVTMLKSAVSKGQDKEIYQAFLTASEWNYNFIPTERTLAQLRTNNYRLITNSHVIDMLSNLEIFYKVYSSIDAFVHGLQNDIDQSAFSFFDRTVVKDLAIIQYTADDISLSLDDIPESAIVNKKDQQALTLFISKLEKYNYYLATSLKSDYMRLLKLMNSTQQDIKKEYQLK